MRTEQHPDDTRLAALNETGLNAEGLSPTSTSVPSVAACPRCAHGRHSPKQNWRCSAALYSNARFRYTRSRRFLTHFHRGEGREQGVSVRTLSLYLINQTYKPQPRYAVSSLDFRLLSSQCRDVTASPTAGNLSPESPLNRVVRRRAQPQPTRRFSCDSRHFERTAIGREPLRTVGRNPTWKPRSSRHQRVRFLGTQSGGSRARADVTGSAHFHFGSPTEREEKPGDAKLAARRSSGGGGCPPPRDVVTADLEWAAPVVHPPTQSGARLPPALRLASSPLAAPSPLREHRRYGHRFPAPSSRSVRLFAPENAPFRPSAVFGTTGPARRYVARASPLWVRHAIDCEWTRDSSIRGRAAGGLAFSLSYEARAECPLRQRQITNGKRR